MFYSAIQLLFFLTFFSVLIGLLYNKQKQWESINIFTG